MVHHQLKDIRKSIYPEEKDLSQIRLWREASRKILKGDTHKISLIIGPCSIHSIDSAIKYAKKLKELSDKVKDRFFLIMRVYLEKSRTSIGWKGFAYDPHLKEVSDIVSGIGLSRKLLKELTHLGVPIALEIVDPLMAHFFHEFATWAFVGARSVSSQVHRQFVSQFDFPIGFKNSVDGNVLPAIYSLESASSPHVFLGLQDNLELEILKTNGNPYTHLVLRGSETATNYDEVSVKEAMDLLKNRGLSTSLVVDCSHGNAQKNPQNQKVAFASILNQILEGNSSIKGLMLESHLKGGSSKGLLREIIDPDLSITDACLGWEETENLILNAYDALAKSTSYSI